MSDIIVILNFIALCLGFVTLYKSVQFLRLTKWNTLAWYFAGAVVLIMSRRIDIILEEVYGISPPAWIDLALIPILVKLCLLIFIMKLVSLYRANVRDIVAATAVQSAALPIVQIDATGMITHVNVALEDLTGFSRQDIVGRPLVNLLPERYRKRHQDAFAKYVQTGIKTLNWSSIKGHVLTKSDEEVPVEIALADFPVGTTRGFIGILRKDESEMHGRDQK